jgi:hypothetical protein
VRLIEQRGHDAAGNDDDFAGDDHVVTGRAGRAIHDRSRR